MEEYRSPFQLPECKDDYCWNPDCPVHCGRKDDPWLAWATYREAYATADGEDEEKAEAARELSMAKMLATVTLSNPPDAKPDYGIWMQTKSTGTKIKIWHDIDGRPHRQEVNRRVLAIHWVVLASLVTWLAVIVTGITLMGGW